MGSTFPVASRALWTTYSRTVSVGYCFRDTLDDRLKSLDELVSRAHALSHLDVKSSTESASVSRVRARALSRLRDVPDSDSGKGSSRVPRKNTLECPLFLDTNSPKSEVSSSADVRQSAEVLKAFACTSTTGTAVSNEPARTAAAKRELHTTDPFKIIIINKTFQRKVLPFADSCASS